MKEYTVLMENIVEISKMENPDPKSTSSNESTKTMPATAANLRAFIGGNKKINKLDKKLKKSKKGKK